MGRIPNRTTSDSAENRAISLAHPDPPRYYRQMNETSATSASGESLLPNGITTLTTIHFAIIAVLALFVIAGLLWGIKAKRSRVKASRDVIANAREAGVEPEPAPEPTADSSATPPPAAAARETPPAPTPAPAPAVDHAAAPVTLLKGLGPKVATRLAELGVTTVGDMAALSETEAQNIDAQLGAFTGRMGRDRWIEQSRLLAAGDKPGFEAVFGKL